VASNGIAGAFHRLVISKDGQERESAPMIVSFAEKGLREVFETGKSRRVRQDLVKRCVQILDAMHQARTLDDLRLPGLRLHPDSRYRPVRWRVDVNGPWRITFEWNDGEASKVDLVQDH
jgi:proteic killer suppression protein